MKTRKPYMMHHPLVFIWCLFDLVILIYQGIKYSRVLFRVKESFRTITPVECRTQAQRQSFLSLPKHILLM